MSGLADASIEFVVLAWNSEHYIEACLESVLALSARRLRVHVVDNGSRDATGQILEELSAGHPELHVIHEPENLGTTVSRNKALAHVRPDTEFVCVLDSDTVVNQGAFDLLIDALTNHRDIGIIGPSMESSAGVRQLSGRNLPTLGIKLRKACPIASIQAQGAALEVPSAPASDGLQDVGYLLSACWVMPHRTLEIVGNLDENIFYAPEDVDYCLRAHEAGLRVVYYERPVIVHEYQRISKRRLVSSTNASHVGGLAYYFRKHGYLFRAPQF